MSTLSYTAFSNGLFAVVGLLVGLYGPGCVAEGPVFHLAYMGSKNPSAD